MRDAVAYEPPPEGKEEEGGNVEGEAGREGVKEGTTRVLLKHREKGR